MATTISYPTNTSGIIVLLKTPKEIPQSSNDKGAHTEHISGQWYMIDEAYTIARQPIKIQDLPYIHHS